jgi:hypothetical protein
MGIRGTLSTWSLADLFHLASYSLSNARAEGDILPTLIQIPDVPSPLSRATVEHVLHEAIAEILHNCLDLVLAVYPCEGVFFCLPSGSHWRTTNPT